MSREERIYCDGCEDEITGQERWCVIVQLPGLKIENAPYATPGNKRRVTLDICEKCYLADFERYEGKGKPTPIPTLKPYQFSVPCGTDCISSEPYISY